ncbi:MAG: hypothetical protein LBH21_04020 [Gracilibacteraceae bacterium]|nr:hypothetical protein [Gracilibacteraceae bacterium]
MGTQRINVHRTRIAIALVLSFILGSAACFTLQLIIRPQSGLYVGDGENLQPYVIRQIAKKIDSKEEFMTIKSAAIVAANNYDETEIAVIQGIYRNPALPADAEVSGMFMAVMEGRPTRFPHYLFGNEPEYKITYWLKSSKVFSDPFQFIPIYPGIVFRDFDMDGKMDFSLEYVTFLANRTSNCTLFFKRSGPDDTWSLINPDLSPVVTEITAADPSILYMYVDTFDFVENGAERKVFSLAKGGDYFWSLNNQSVKEPDVVLSVQICVNRDEPAIAEHGYAVVSFVFSGEGDLVRRHEKDLYFSERTYSIRY